MGQFCEFAQKETNSFEALFIKFPFNYTELTSGQYLC